MRTKRPNAILENINTWLLRVTVGGAVLYFILLLQTQAYPLDLSLKGKLPVSGELSITGIGLDEEENNNITRLKEFRYFPSSGVSVSSLVLQREDSLYRVKFDAKDLGESDVDANLIVDVGEWLHTDTRYVKIPHVTSLTDFTLRSNNTFSARLLPLSFVSAEVMAYEEDKVGRYESANPAGFFNIGQKEQYASVAADAAWTFANLSIKYESSKLKQPQVGSDLKSTTIALQNAQDVLDSYAGLAYNATDISSQITGVKDIEVRKWKLEASHNVTDAVSVEVYYTSNKRTNKNAGAISKDTKSYLLSAGYHYGGDEGSVLKNADASLSYAKESTDYANAGIAKEDIKTWALSGKAKFTCGSVKANYEKSDKDTSGLTSAALQNFNELSYNAKTWGISVSSKPAVETGQLSATVYLKRNVTEPVLVSGYGINSVRTNLNGATLSYLIRPNVTLTYNWVLTEWRKSGSFKYHASPDVDAVFSVFDNNEFHQGVVDVSLSDKTSLSAGYSESDSELYDPVYAQTNAREQEMSLSGNHALTEDLSLSLVLKRNIYKDPFNTAFQGQTNLIKLEVTKKF